MVYIAFSPAYTIMKNLKKPLLVLTAVCGIYSAWAQEATGSYSRIYGGFSTASIKDQDGSDKGAHIGYMTGLNITGQKDPLFLQLGVEGNWLTSSVYGIKETLLNFSVPVNLSYKFAFSDNMSFEPFAGLNLKLNTIGKITDEDDDELNYFDDLEARRFQVGVNVGAGLNIGSFYVGYHFSPDLMDYFDVDGVDSKFKSHYITVGVNF